MRARRLRYHFRAKDRRKLLVANTQLQPVRPEGVGKNRADHGKTATIDGSFGGKRAAFVSLFSKRKIVFSPLKMISKLLYPPFVPPSRLLASVQRIPYFYRKQIDLRRATNLNHLYNNRYLTIRSYTLNR